MATLENGDVLEENDILTYAEAFPPLFTTTPIEQVPPVPVKSKSPWATQYTIPSSTVTQVSILYNITGVTPINYNY